jgi:hypothetical protein
MATATECPGIVITDPDGTDHFCAFGFVGQRRAKSLDLTKVKLHSLPDKLLEVSDLEILILDVANMEDIPESMGKLERLTSLHLTNCGAPENGLRKFPTAVKSLPNLTTLELFANKNMERFPEGICSCLRNLQKLFIVMCGVKLLPSDFNEMSELQYLDVTGSRAIGNLSEALVGLEKLWYLALGHERLGELIEKAPESVRAGLTSIEIQKLPTAVIPRQLMLLKSLEALYFEDSWNNMLPLLRRHLERAASNQSDLVIPPDEVLTEGQEAIDSYYDSLVKSSSSRQKRVKVLLNGKSMAGKTSTPCH